ncbi:MAG TPA: WecB/TagA/CpsF family glycosyltransferase [Anaeromyxobacteraceae bacterium]|nr:WecB/TagA/CpsF family glycosyltransferase [Anaeromyxobacteraceae bacterium]
MAPSPTSTALALAPRAPAAEVLGIPISGLTCAEFVELAVRRVAAGLRTLFTTANAHSIVVAQRIPAFQAHFREADAVLPDGMLAVLGARWRRGEVPERVAGPDFLEAFLARAAAARLRVFFLGASEATLARIVERCRMRFPGLEIVGTIAPPFGDWGDEVDAALAAAVNAAHPDALFVGMTAPKQELWLSRNLHGLDVPFAMGVGAAFDFLAGTKPRAPRAVGRLGLEWLWRLVAEPRRMWRRNLSSAVFVWKLLTHG